MDKPKFDFDLFFKYIMVGMLIGVSVGFGLVVSINSAQQKECIAVHKPIVPD